MTSVAAADPFAERAEEYDRWFEASPVFAVELAALRAVSTDLPRPWLEVGVGPGRFARELGIDFGIDPARPPLQLARRRGIMTIQGTGECLPVRPVTIGTGFLLFTLCFVADPAAVIGECARVIKPGGRLLLGLIPANSAWGNNLRARGKAGDPFYRHARFFTIVEAERLIGAHNFLVSEAWSTLRQEPGGQIRAEEPVAGAYEEAGFCVLIAKRQGARP